MRKIIVLVILGLTAMTAAPFNTLPAYTIPRGSGFVGLTTPVQIPFQGSLSATPTLWAGYGVIPHFDVTLMLGTTVADDGFSPSDAMIEFRYATLGYEDVVARDHFVFAPVLDFYIPTREEGSWAVGPGALVTGNFGFWQLHGNLFTYFPFNVSGMLIGFLSPEILLGTDPRSQDTDMDMISDGDEFYLFFTDPCVWDSDQDGVGDGEEVYFFHSNPMLDDSDGDTLTDGQEILVYLSDPMDEEE